MGYIDSTSLKKKYMVVYNALSREEVLGISKEEQEKEPADEPSLKSEEEQESAVLKTPKAEERFSLGPSETPKGRTTTERKKEDKKGTRGERGRKVQALNTPTLESLWQKRSKIEENERGKRRKPGRRDK